MKAVSNLLICIMLFSFILSRDVFPNQLILDIYVSLRIICFVLVLVLYIYKVINKKAISPVIIFLLIYIFSLVISTHLNDGNMLDLLISFSGIIGACLLVDMEMERNAVNILKCLLLLFISLMLINTLSIPMYINKDSVRYGYIWLIGYKNTATYYLLPMVCFSFLYSQHIAGKNRVRDYIILAASFLCVLYANSATGIALFFLTIIFMILASKCRFTGVLNMRVYVLVTALLMLSFVVLHMQVYFEYVITNILNRDISFTHRTYIWDNAIEEFKQKPIFGYGHTNSSLLVLRGESYGAIHNLFLEILCSGGIVAFVIFAIMLWSVTKKLYLHRNCIFSYQTSFILFMFLILSLFENTYFNECFYIMLVFSWHIDKISAQALGEQEQLQQECAVIKI